MIHKETLLVQTDTVVAVTNIPFELFGSTSHACNTRMGVKRGLQSYLFGGEPVCLCC